MNDERDMLYKEKMKRSGLNIKVHNFMVGDYVLLKQENKQMVNCLLTSFLHGYCQWLFYHWKNSMQGL